MKRFSLMKICLIIAMLAVMLVASQMVYAAEMPDVNVDVKILYNMADGKLFTAAGPGVTVFTAFDKILRFNMEVALPESNRTNSDFIIGPFLKVDFIQLLSKSDKIEIMKGVNLEAGAGVMFDVFHIDGMNLEDWRAVTFPGVSVGVRF